MVEKAQNLKCKRCGRHFDCHVNNIGSCQCAEVMLSKETHAFLDKTMWECLCANCLQEMDGKIKSIQGQVFPSPGELKAGVHYYLENGFWVFTELYHMLRGHCCKSGCRHCAYGYKRVKV